MQIFFFFWQSQWKDGNEAEGCWKEEGVKQVYGGNASQLKAQKMICLLQKWDCLQFLTMVQSGHASFIPRCVSRGRFQYSHRNQKHLRFIRSTPSKSRHHLALLQALRSLASPFQTGRASCESNGAKHSGTRAKALAQLTWLKRGLVKSQFLPFQFFLSSPLCIPPHQLRQLQCPGRHGRCICKRFSQILFLPLIPCTQGQAWLSFTTYPRILRWWEISL